MPETLQHAYEELLRQRAELEERIAGVEKRNAELEARIVELEERNAELEARAAHRGAPPDARDVTEQKLTEQAARQSEVLLRAIVDQAPLLLFAKDLSGRYILLSRWGAEVVGTPAEQILGKTDFEAFPKELAERFVAIDREILSTLEPKGYDELIPRPEDPVHLYSIKFPIFDAAGKLYGICGISADITERRKAQEKIRKLQEEMIRVQEGALRALAAPLIPIARGVLVMPLIGDIDQSRLRQVLETLLEGVSRSRARVALLDITGVQRAGPEVADGLLQAARAVRLLGAQVVLTGVQPALAQILAGLAEGLSGVVVRGTLESGIAYAMGARHR
jgi:PAS domain S-box-containing protein